MEIVQTSMIIIVHDLTIHVCDEDFLRPVYLASI